VKNEEYYLKNSKKADIIEQYEVCIVFQVAKIYEFLTLDVYNNHCVSREKNDSFTENLTAIILVLFLEFRLTFFVLLVNISRVLIENNKFA
jgi:hypothetical protein